MKGLSIEEKLDLIINELATVKKTLVEVLRKQGQGIQEGCSDEIMTVKQLSQYLGLDPNVIYAKCAKGDIPYFKLGKGYRFKLMEIKTWVEKQKELPDISVDAFVEDYLQSHKFKP